MANTLTLLPALLLTPLAFIHSADAPVSPEFKAKLQSTMVRL